MRNEHNLSFTKAARPYIAQIDFFGCMVLAVLLTSCSYIPHSNRGIELQGDINAPTPRYSLVFIIHGDGDYLYYDPCGNAHRADEKALLSATRVAMRNPQAEVFIFHQKSRRHSLLFFPHRDGDFSYYRHGKLLAKKSYRRDQEQSRFDPEVALYNKYRLMIEPSLPTEEDAESAKFFFYFGHEIPEFRYPGYDASHHDRTFTVDDLAEGLNGIIRDSAKFDLVVLSTCFGGTPHTIGALSPFAQFIVASPENLHLSYFDLHPFERLDLVLQEGDMSAFATSYARQAFDRLSEAIQTSITVAAYDVESVQGYLNAVGSVYDHLLATVKLQPPEAAEHCDCAEEPAFILPGMSEGVTIFYRPPRFGPSKYKLNHSGWECWRLRESETAASPSISDVR